MTDHDRHRAEGYLQSLFPAARVQAEPDYAAAYSASDAGTDVCIIAGTGSLVCSRIDGQMVKSGGRGYLLGDFGSAFRIGREALLFYLNRPGDASADLKEVIGKVFESTVEGDIVSHLYQLPSPQSALAKLAKALGVDARSGLDYALTIIGSEMGLLADVVVKHTNAYFSSRRDLRITLAGGLWQNAPQFRDTFDRKLHEKLPTMNLEVHRIVRPPVYGAVMLAKEMAYVN